MLKIIAYNIYGSLTWESAANVELIGDFETKENFVSLSDELGSYFDIVQIKNIIILHSVLWRNRFIEIHIKNNLKA